MILDITPAESLGARGGTQLLPGHVVSVGVRTEDAYVGDPTQTDLLVLIEDEQTVLEFVRSERGLGLPFETELRPYLAYKDGFILKIIADMRNTDHGRFRYVDYHIVLWPVGADIQ